jgi:hypothetical protein
MKKFLAFAVIAITAVTLYATAAPAGQQAVTPAQFNALKRQVNKVRTDLNTVTTVLASCVMGSAIPITQYNNYVAVDSNNQLFKTTGLDITVQGGTPNGFALLVNPDPACVNLVNTTSFKRFATAHSLHFAIAKRPAFQAASHQNH